MYAGGRTGGKQYRLGVGDSVKVEKLPDEVGNIVELSQILMVSDGGEVKVGTPLVPGASVKAEIVGHGRNKKIRGFKMKRRKQYRRTQGHRQAFTQLKVTEINA